jgi:hypothetical protein
MPDNNSPYGRWKRDELRHAEATARQFLEENRAQIAEAMRAKTRVIQTLLDRVASDDIGFQERLELFARISEIARLMEEDADGFFELASQPVVAQILNTASES